MKLNRVFRGDYIQGHFLRPNDPNGEVISRNPGDLGQPDLLIPFSYEHVHEAVSAAKRGLSSWRRLPPQSRGAFLLRYHDLLKQRGEELSHAISYEIGKPLWESRQEVQDCLLLIQYFLKEGSQTTQQLSVPDAGPECTGTVRFLSRGVMAVITPANQPAFLPHFHVIPSLINGNTVVFKSSKYAPMVGQCLAEIIHDSGLPAGVLNMIHGDSEAARRLVSHHDVDGVFFTGPYETGFKIKKQTLSDYWKVLVMDMGGKNAIVVWNDCQYEKALHEAVLSSFLTSGQRCTSTSRVLVHDKIFDRFLEDFHGLAKKCKVGYGVVDGDKAPFMGPLVSESSQENYLRYQGIAVREGCEEVMRGKTLDKDKKGYYVSPSIHWVKNPEPKSVYQKNEIHGPNVALFRVSDLDETVEVLNQPQHGLAAAIYTGSRENYLYLADEARVGLLHWNRMTIENSYRLPYAGTKKSGNNRPMGSFAGYQCTYPVSSLENTGAFSTDKLPAALPKKASNS